MEVDVGEKCMCSEKWVPPPAPPTLSSISATSVSQAHNVVSGGQMSGSFMRFSTSKALAGESTMVTRKELAEVVGSEGEVVLLVLDSDPSDGCGCGNCGGSGCPVDVVIAGVGPSTCLVKSRETGVKGDGEVLPDDDFN